jgi:hypothetical protein
MYAFKVSFSILLLVAVVVVVGSQYGLADVAGHLQQLSLPIVCVAIAGLLANAMMAVLRFRVLASDAGHPIGLRRAMGAVGAGSVAGALFFQIAGQLMARGVVMRRGGVPFGVVVVVTLYERIAAAGVSGLIAVLGAVHIFGRIYLDQSAGGGHLVKIVCGLAAAVGMAGLLGFGGLVQQHVWPLLTRHFVLRLLRVAGLTVLVQLPMMVVYVTLAHEFSPETPIIDLVAASAIVMFAASVPISLAGWGVRELSAVVALGAIGMSASGALTTAIIIGAGSLFAMGALFAFSMHDEVEGSAAVEGENVAPIDYAQALAWILPLMAAVFVLFQVYLPIGSGLLNVNLADPVVILGGSLFVLRAVSRKQLPAWRVPYVNLFAVLATLALALSLLVGVSRFGWTDWALVNRFAGWFVLLAYASTGALITSFAGMRALRVMAATYAGAAAGVVLVEVAMVLLNALGVKARDFVALDGIQGFAQNHNFLAFQLLMAASAILVFFSGASKRALLGLLLVALWFAGSRSGWISIGCILAAALYSKHLGIRDLVAAVGCAVVAGVLVLLLQILAPYLPFGGAEYGAEPVVPHIFPTEASSSERLLTLVGGWKMFADHPIFGAGLGAFRNLNILATSGIPLVIHSTALWLLAELGLLGFLIFAIPGFYVWFSQWRAVRSDPAAAIIAFCFLGFAVMSGPADMVYQRTFWLMVGAALAVPRPIESGSEAAIAPSAA